MNSDIVEAVQCKLAEGYILWPGTPANPPQRIAAEDIFYHNPRIFTEPNPAGPIFEYEFFPGVQMWILKGRIEVHVSDRDSTATTEA